MKKAIETTILNNAIYPFDKFVEISNKAYWGEDLDDVKAIDGALAQKIAAKDNVIIATNGNLLEGVLYVFRWTKATDKLVPLRVSMHPKTIANITNGSNRYGSGSIIAEL